MSVTIDELTLALEKLTRGMMSDGGLLILDKARKDFILLLCRYIKEQLNPETVEQVLESMTTGRRDVIKEIGHGEQEGATERADHQAIETRSSKKGKSS